MPREYIWQEQSPSFLWLTKRATVNGDLKETDRLSLAYTLLVQRNSQNGQITAEQVLLSWQVTDETSSLWLQRSATDRHTRDSRIQQFGPASFFPPILLQPLTDFSPHPANYDRAWQLADHVREVNCLILSSSLSYSSFWTPSDNLTA